MEILDNKINCNYAIHILNVRGIKDAIPWLNRFDYSEYCLFLADIAELFLPFYEKYQSSEVLKTIIQDIRDFKEELITRNQLLANSKIAVGIANPIKSKIKREVSVAVAAISAATRPIDTKTVPTLVLAISSIAGWGDVKALYVKHFSKRKN